MGVQSPLADFGKPVGSGRQQEETKRLIRSGKLDDGYIGSLQEPKEEEEKLEETIKSLSEGFRKLKAENTRLRTSTQNLLAENATLLEAIQQEQKENTALRQALQKAEEERLAAQRSLNRAREREEEVRATDQQARTEADALRRQLSTKELEIQAIKRELHNKGTESPKVVGSMQEYQPKMATEGDVCSLVTALNTEITETCMAIVHSESFAFGRKPMENIEDGYLARMSSCFSKCSVMGWLREQQIIKDPTVLEIVLQEALVAVSSWIISERDPDLEGIEPTETRLIRTCDDPWRSWAHILARGLPCNALRSTLQWSISRVLFLVVMRSAGYVSDHTVVREFNLKANGHLTKIIDLALQLNAILRRGGVRGLWLLRGVPGEQFDSDMMDNFAGLEEADQIDGTIIFSTTALGLCRIDIKPEIYTAGLHYDPIIKPKVVLKSFLDSLRPEGEDSDDIWGDLATGEDLDEYAGDDFDADSTRS
ncbi:hypothetical protein EDC04DRAFT_712084 [Pisolithus marmoratus]|nr:hypothetical protein EDC04DRAFT_712084 [Pisolithus marmoratus]